MKAGVPRFQEQIWDPDGARKADIVAQTCVRFNKKELFQLIDACMREYGKEYSGARIGLFVALMDGR